MAKVVFNVSKNKLNYSQRNNNFVFKHGAAEIKNSTMCNVTSMCMALDYAGYQFPTGLSTQPEDNLADFLVNDSKVDAFYKEKMPAMYAAYKAGKEGCYPPNEVHEVLAYGTNLWMGTTAVNFSTNVKISDIKKQLLIEGRPVVMSGLFNNLHHVVCLVGLTFEVPDNVLKFSYARQIKYISDNKIPPSEIIIDDPWGNPLKDYKEGISGNDIKLPWSFFINNMKPLGNATVKWAHMINEAAAVV